jgi:hypothetical protein
MYDDANFRWEKIVGICIYKNIYIRRYKPKNDDNLEIATARLGEGGKEQIN